MTAVAAIAPPLELHLPLPPSANRAWRVYRGRMVLSAESRCFRRKVAQVVEVANLPGFGKAPVRVLLEVEPPARGARRDADNSAKALLDALTAAGVWDDDGQVAELHVWRTGRGDGDGAVRVTVEALA